MTPSVTFLKWAGTTIAIILLMFMLVPLLVLVPIAFNDGTFFTLPRNGWSFRWFQTVATDPNWHLAARNSVIIGVMAAAISLLLGVAAAIGLAYTKSKILASVYYLMMLPMLTPVIVTALAMYISYSAIGLTETRAGLTVAHAIIGLPFVVIAVLASLRKFDIRLYHAALSLGANPLKAFRWAVLPAILPGVLAGGLYAFQASFDESVIVILMASPDQVTLPRKIFSGVTDNINPGVAVVAVVTTLVSIFALSLTLFIRKGDIR